jgi:hypothetical protein
MVNKWSQNCPAFRVSNCDPKYLAMNAKRFYSIRVETDSTSGDFRFRVIVLYSNGRMRPLQPHFSDESSVEDYLSKWTPELSGKRIEYLEMVVEASRCSQAYIASRNNRGPRHSNLGLCQRA